MILPEIINILKRYNAFDTSKLSISNKAFFFFIYFKYFIFHKINEFRRFFFKYISRKIKMDIKSTKERFIEIFYINMAFFIEIIKTR